MIRLQLADVGIDQAELRLQPARHANGVQAAGFGQATRHLGLAGAFGGDRAAARDGIGRLTDGTHDTVVIVGGRQVERGGRARQSGAQPSAVEDRQMDRRTRRGGRRIGGEQIAQPDGLETGQRGQVDIGQERLARDLLPLARGIDPGERGGDVRRRDSRSAGTVAGMGKAASKASFVGVMVAG